LEADLIESAAFRRLSGLGHRLLLLFLARRHFEDVLRSGERRSMCINLRSIQLPYRVAAKALHCSQEGFRQALDGLIGLGFVDVIAPGGFEAGERRPTVYGISDRWRLYGTQNFDQAQRVRKAVRYGFQASPHLVRLKNCTRNVVPKRKPEQPRAAQNIKREGD